jgi:diguanylate cyclase (GGDEF)-like protein
MQEQQGAGLVDPVCDSDPLSPAEMLALIAVQRDLITRQAAELAHQRLMFETASKAADIGLWQCRLADEALTWSDPVYDLFDLPVGVHLNRSAIVEHYVQESAEELAEKRARAIEQGSGFAMEACIVTADNRNRWIRITATVERAAGRAVRLFGMKQDITEAKLLLDRKRYLADVDAMTGLANRHRFEECLVEQRQRDQLGALMIIDLDGFKTINDTHGHAAGDQCLREAARRLAAACQSCVPLVARIGGDEFAVLFDRTACLGTVSDAARRILDHLGSPLAIGSCDLTLSASIGIATHSGGFGDDPFVEADKALYAAKHAGKNTFRIAKPGLAAGRRTAAA